MNKINEKHTETKNKRRKKYKKKRQAKTENSPQKAQRTWGGACRTRLKRGHIESNGIREPPPQKKNVPHQSDQTNVLKIPLQRDTEITNREMIGMPRSGLIVMRVFKDAPHVGM